MSIEKVIQRLRAQRRQAYDVLINPKSSEAYKRMARKQIKYCDKHIPILEKAFPKSA